MKNTLENRNKLTGVIAKAWMDGAYKDELMKDPRAVISDAGVNIDGDYEIVAVEDNVSRKYVVLDTVPLPDQIALASQSLPTNPNFYQVNAYVYQRCVTDKHYRAYFIQHPEQAFEDLNYHLPEGFNIVVKENSAEKKHFVLPVKPKIAVQTESLQNEVAMFATAPVNANANANVNANVNVNGDVNINGGVQVNGVAVGTVVVAVAVLI